jgi:hypothetical protein
MYQGERVRVGDGIIYIYMGVCVYAYGVCVCACMRMVCVCVYAWHAQCGGVLLACCVDIGRGRRSYRSRGLFR